MGLVKEFKEFAMKGNMIDLAVGVVIGVAFGDVIKSLVGDIINPALGLLTGGINLQHWSVRIGTNPAGQAVLLKYGAFIQTVISFFIIAAVIFFMLKGINKLKRPPAPAAAPPPPRSEVLLEEIRNLLAKR